MAFGTQGLSVCRASMSSLVLKQSKVHGIRSILAFSLSRLFTAEFCFQGLSVLFILQGLQLFCELEDMLASGAFGFQVLGLDCQCVEVFSQEMGLGFNYDYYNCHYFQSYCYYKYYYYHGFRVRVTIRRPGWRCWSLFGVGRFHWVSWIQISSYLSKNGFVFKN